MKRSRRTRIDKNFKQVNIDVYEGTWKKRGPALCTGCGAVFRNGRWFWGNEPPTARLDTCPACRRIADNYPAGYLEMKGPFFEKNREEIMNLIRNGEELEKKDRPLERIMAVNEESDRTVITTTGIHIARRLGEALSRAYQGDFSFDYGDSEKSIRVYWSR